MANNEGWYLEYFREAYNVWFMEGKEAVSKKDLKKTLKNSNKTFD